MIKNNECRIEIVSIYAGIDYQPPRNLSLE